METTGDAIKSCYSILQKALDCPCEKDRGVMLKEFCSLVRDLDETSCLNLINSTKLHDMLNKVLATHAFVPEFCNREFTSYDKSDFNCYDVSAHDILDCAISFISLVKSHDQGDQTHQTYCNSSHQQILDSENESGYISVKEEAHYQGRNALKTHSSYSKNCVSKILPNLILIIGGNIRCPLWSSKNCQSLSIELLKNIIDLFGFNDIQELLVKYNVHQDTDEIQKVKDKTVLAYLFHLFEKPLSRDKWGKNPFLGEVFNWTILNVKPPYLSNHIDQVMAICLNFIHSHETVYKSNGLQSLTHLIENVSGEELRWYNRADVIYDTLKHQMYSKEVLTAVLQNLFAILKVLERNPLEISDKHHEILTNLASDAEMENLIVARRILISNLARFILDCGILCIQHLSKLLQVIEIFLDVDDSPQELARIDALQALENITIVLWPRMHSHSENILQWLLKLVINVNTLNSKSEDARPTDVKEKLISKSATCTKLLLKINPNLSIVLEEAKQSPTLLMLHRFCGDV